MTRRTPRNLLRALLGGAALLVVALAVLAPLGFAWWVSGRVIGQEGRNSAEAEDPALVQLDPAQVAGLAFREVEFPTQDGLVLRGWFVPADVSGTERVGVVSVHGRGGDRRNGLRLAPPLHRAGYDLLLYDSRDHGKSDRSPTGTAFAGGVLDVLAAQAFLRRDAGVVRVAAIGGSQGATNALLAAALDAKAIDAVIADGAGTSMYALLRHQRSLAFAPDWLVGLCARTTLLRMGRIRQGLFDPESGPASLIERIAPRPVLLIHGSQDPLVSADGAREMYRRAGEPKELWIIEGGGHLDYTDREEYAARVSEFLARHLRSRPQ
jgi:pimeloyl-ACP methyl ester carboxylesterase